MMRKKTSDTHQKLSRKLFAAFSLVGVLSALMVGAYFYYYQSVKLLSQSSYFYQMKNWVAKERAYLQNKSKWESPKKGAMSISTNKESEYSPVRFEFYHALGTMQVTIPQAIADNHQSLEVERVNDTHKLKRETLKGKQVVKKEKKLASSKYFDAETLKRELARELKK